MHCCLVGHETNGQKMPIFPLRGISTLNFGPFSTKLGGTVWARVVELDFRKSDAQVVLSCFYPVF